MESHQAALIEQYHVYPNLENQQFQFSTSSSSSSSCGFDISQSKCSPCNWTEAEGYRLFPGSNSFQYWREPFLAEVSENCNNQPYDAPQYWDIPDYNSFPNGGHLIHNAMTFGPDNYSRKVAWNGWGKFPKDETPEARDANFFPCGKPELLFHNSLTSFNESLCSPVAMEPLTSGHQAARVDGHCAYSSQHPTDSSVKNLCLPCAKMPVGAATAPATAPAAAVPVGFESNFHPKKKKRKREINKIQRQAANLRERRRMNRLNSAFDQLWQKMPKQAFGHFSKNLSSQIKFSRVFILRSALCYIEYLKGLLDGKVEINPELPSTIFENV